MTAILPIWDPHFHLFDVSETTQSGHDSKVLFAPHGNPVYPVAAYEQDISAAGAEFQLIGGTWLEAISVCHLEKSATELNTDCLAEAKWANKQLQQSDKNYVLISSAALEDPAVGDMLAQLAQNKAVRGVRQILNYKPSWPRNDRLGELLDNPQWQQGFTKLQEYGFSFDLQLNPHQFQKAAAFIRQFPQIPIIINHLGSPTLDDLQNKSQQYWQGMQALADCKHSSIKISMLQYTHPDWDQLELVSDAIYKIIDLFGIRRCFFASNFPVDIKAGWPAERLYGAFRKLVETRYTPAEQRLLFAENAQQAYQINHRYQPILKT